MQQQPSPSDDRPAISFLTRVNRVLGDFNVFLFAVAIGLATLDFTCFVLLRVVANLSRLPVSTG
jgi:hypothetical protein